MNSDSIDRSWRALPALRLPLSGFLEERGQGVDNLLATLVRRINAGNLAYLGVPADLVYRLACLCSRWSPDLQEFIAQVLERSGNLDHFLTQPAAADHHAGMYGLFEASITAAEFAMNADHDARSRKPLPPIVSELQQVCSATAFLFDLGKVFSEHPGQDLPRSARRQLHPHADLARCWRSSWTTLARRNPILASWLDQVASRRSGATAAVRAARALTHNAVRASWRSDSQLLPV